MCDGSASERVRTALFEALKNLHEGPLVLPQVVQLGESAVPALEELLRGPSSAIHHARCLAANGLGAIPGPAATEALVRALRDSVARKLDPVSLEAESVIVNCIAEHLSHRPGAQVTQALLEALRVRPYPFCALALAQKNDLRAIPLLVQCLADDAARSASLAALRAYGRPACPALIRLLIEDGNSRGMEPPTHIDGRVAAVRLLGELANADRAPSGALLALHAGLNDRQRAVRLEAAVALSRITGEARQGPAAILTEALDEPDWAYAETVMETLVRMGPVIAPFVAKVIGAPAAGERNRRRRLRAVKLAGQLRAPSVVSALASLRHTSDPELRRAAVTALRQIPDTGSSSLERFLSDTDGTVRLRALEGLHERNALACPTLAMLLGDPDRAVRRAARLLLQQHRSSAVTSLKRIVCTFGLPLNGLRRRARLWWYACMWLIACRYGPASPTAAGRTSSTETAPKIRR